MVILGLTGGIGAGKSTVGQLLVQRGAHLIDGDLLARAVVEPDGEAYAALRQRFGDRYFGDDGRLDRQSLARLVFSDETERRALEAITHPAIAARMRAARDTHRGTDHVVIQDVPLLTPATRPGYDFDGVIVVDCPPELALARLMEHRGFTEEEARARMAAQISRSERLSMADFVVDNSGDPVALRDRVDEAWQWARSLAGRR